MEKNKIKIFSLILFTAVFVCCFSFFSNALAVPDTTLYFNPSTDSFNVGDDFTLDAMIDPGENSVSAVTLHFTFDYTKLRLESITESAAFSDVLSAASINNTNGTASIDLGVGTSNPSVSEISTMATLNFHALSAGNNSLVEYTSASMAAAEGESGDVVTERQGATLTIVEADTTAPTITSISSNKANGTYTIGEVIDIDVTFSEAVTSTGNVTVTLETGDTDRTCTFTMSNAITGTCNYTVQAGDTTSDLNAIISGTINDQSSNPMTNFTPTTGLAANKAIVIDTTVIPPVEEEDDDSEEEDDHDSLDLDDVEYTSTANTITIKWETNNKADSKVKYGKFKNALTKEKENKEEEKKHKITLKDLEPGTEYFFKIYSEDEYGDKETSDFYSIATTKNNLLVPSNPIADVGNEVVRKEETQQQGEKQEEKQGKNQEENKNFIQEVKFKIVDDKGVPIADLFVTIYSEPQSAYTDKSGVVTFKNIALGKHTIKFVYNDKNYAEVVELTEFNTKKGAIALPSVESKPEIKIFENESKFSWKIIFYIVAVALTLVFTVWFLRKKFEK